MQIRLLGNIATAQQALDTSIDLAARPTASANLEAIPVDIRIVRRWVRGITGVALTSISQVIGVDNSIADRVIVVDLVATPSANGPVLEPVPSIFAASGIRVAD